MGQTYLQSGAAVRSEGKGVMLHCPVNIRVRISDIKCVIFLYDDVQPSHYPETPTISHSPSDP